MNRWLVAPVLVAVLSSCATTTTTTEPKKQSGPDPIPVLIVQRYGDCMPGLKAKDVKRISDHRYSVMTDQYAVAWTVGGENKKTGEPITLPADDSMDQMERLGCM